MASWYQTIDSDVIPTSIAQFTDPDEVAVIGNVRRVEGSSRFDDGVALNFTSTGRNKRLPLESIDAPLSFPSEISTNPSDAEFGDAGRLIIVGSSASNNAAVDTNPFGRFEGEPSVWQGAFGTGFSVTGIGLPAERQNGILRAVSLRNGGIYVGDFGVEAGYSVNGDQPNLIVRDGSASGVATATNGKRLVVSEVSLRCLRSSPYLRLHSE